MTEKRRIGRSDVYPLMVIVAGSFLASLAATLLWTYSVAARQGDEVTLTMNSVGEFWGEVTTLACLVVLGAALVAVELYRARRVS